MNSFELSRVSRHFVNFYFHDREGGWGGGVRDLQTKLLQINKYFLFICSSGFRFFAENRFKTKHPERNKFHDMCFGGQKLNSENYIFVIYPYVWVRKIAPYLIPRVRGGGGPKLKHKPRQ